MKIWIDLSNSPHALLFAPVATALSELGHEVAVTARDNAQTVELARATWPSVAVVGDESPKGRLGKLDALRGRIAALRRWARAEGADMALSHNSYAQIVAARSLRIPAVTAMDFEHQPANHLAFRLARGIVMPEALRPMDMRAQGARPGKTHFYDGLKEEIYLGDFEPDRGILERLGIERDGDEPLVVVRTPPSRALYHRVESNLFVDLLRRAAQEGARSVVLARFREQRKELRELNLPRNVIPEQAVDSRSLMYMADAFIGAGGTMTREAALMGIPTVSTFAAKRPAVDVWLEEQGLLRFASSVDEAPPVRPRPSQPRPIESLRSRSSELTEKLARVFVQAGSS
jgi:predicted glycosyltransferase